MKGIPPFYVGQKIVAITDGPGRVFKKGDKFIVHSICKKCCFWRVTVGIRIMNGVKYIMCSGCGNQTPVGLEWEFIATRFKPLDEGFKEMEFLEVVKEEEKMCVN